MEYPTPKQREDAAKFAKQVSENPKLEVEREIYLATRQMNKFKSERIRGHYQAQIDALSALI